MPIPIEIFIDISGSPRGNIFIGAVSFNSYQASQFESHFIKNFPLHKKNRWKASQMKGHELLKIIKFLNDNKLFMACTKISSQDWQRYKINYSKKAYLNDKIIGIYYSDLLRSFTIPKSIKPQKYNVTFCKESSINIDKAINVCHKISKAYNRNFGFKTALAKHETLLKFSDYVAGAYKKTNVQELEKIKYLKIIKKYPEPFMLLKTFGKIER